MEKTKIEWLKSIVLQGVRLVEIWLIYFYQFLRGKVFTPQVLAAITEFLVDLKDSFIRMILGIRLPEKGHYINFILIQLIGNVSGWTAGILASDLVSSYFKTRSVKNLWGLVGKNDGRTIISKEDYELYSWWASYLSGLIIMLVVRYVVFNVIEEYKKIKLEKQALLDH